MNKKAILLKIVSITLVICSFMLAIIFNIGSILIISILIFLGGRQIIYRTETRRLVKAIKEFPEDDYLSMINYLKGKIGSFWLYMTNHWCYYQLVYLYMLNDEAIKAKYILERNPKFKRNKYMYYIQLILGCAEQDKIKVEYYANLVLGLNNKKFNVQIDSTKMILNMLKTKTFVQELYDKTKYPLLKKICMKYQDNSIELDDLKIENINTYVDTYNKPKGILYVIKIALNVLSIASLWLSLMVIAFINVFNDNSSSIETTYNMMKNMRVFYLFLPITIGNIIFSIFLKYKRYKYVSGIIIGIIMSFFLCVFGSMSLSQNEDFSTDKAYLEEYSYIFDVPTDYKITTSKSTYVTTENEDTVYYNQSIIRINDINYKDKFDKTNWSTTLVSLKSVPLNFLMEVSQYEYFLVYCEDTLEYNPIYTYHDNDYSYVAIAYDEETNTLFLMTYCKPEVVPENS